MCHRAAPSSPIEVLRRSSIGQRTVRTDSIFDLVIDDERNILYLLLDSHIQMFDLGFRGDGLRYVSSIDMLVRWWPKLSLLSRSRSYIAH